MQLPHVTTAHVDRFEQRNINTIKDLQSLPRNKFQTILQETLRTPQHITEFTQAFQSLPSLSLSLTLLSHDESESWNPISSSGNQLFDVKPSRELRLEITVTRGGVGRAVTGGTSEEKIFSPRYHKSKSISWWLVLGTPSGELLAMKRIGSVGMSNHPISHSLLFSSPSQGDTEQQDYLVFLIPDSVYGLEALGEFHLKTKTT